MRLHVGLVLIALSEALNLAAVQALPAKKPTARPGFCARTRLNEIQQADRSKVTTGRRAAETCLVPPLPPLACAGALPCLLACAATPQSTTAGLRHPLLRRLHHRVAARHRPVQALRQGAAAVELRGRGAAVPAPVWPLPPRGDGHGDGRDGAPALAPTAWRDTRQEEGEAWRGALEGLPSFHRHTVLLLGANSRRLRLLPPCSSLARAAGQAPLLRRAAAAALHPSLAQRLLQPSGHAGRSLGDPRLTQTACPSSPPAPACSPGWWCC